MAFHRARLPTEASHRLMTNAACQTLSGAGARPVVVSEKLSEARPVPGAASAGGGSVGEAERRANHFMTAMVAVLA